MEPRKIIILGVAGGIAAYKSCELVRLLREKNVDVRVVMTKAAQEFVTPMTFQALSQNPVHTSLFDLTQESQMGHIHLADTADLICIAPATADVIARLAHGLCDDLLTTIVCVSRAKKILCPSMNVHMWKNPLVQRNIKILQDLGFEIMEPASGSLACGYEGKGRLPEPAVIADRIETLLAGAQPLKGKRVLVTAGPTREFMDPFRFLSNPSSGKMGIAFAEAACALGASVELLLGPTLIRAPIASEKFQVSRFTSAKDLYDLCLDRAHHADIVVMAAAVADYTFAETHDQKIKKEKTPKNVALEPTIDILKELGHLKKRQFLIGFAAESENIEVYAKKKLEEKNCDVILANHIGAGAGFESNDNTLTIFQKSKLATTLGPLPKTRLALEVLQRLFPVA